MCNMEIRLSAKKSKIKLWQIAEHLGLNDGNFSRKLRRELPDDRKKQIMNIIYELAKENEK